MSGDWRTLHADQNLQLAKKMLNQQAEINTLRADLATAETRGYQRAIETLREAARVADQCWQANTAVQDGAVCRYAADYLTAHAERTQT